ncbi:hypothetical protein [Citrobacter braakii]|uniref:hypothetical protein n=1 Tax=Citrobacter braakii TaxID=57706 RepID=UPI002B2F2186|nr:hypothetical protein R0Q77_12940 [Citrobacter braakii]
MLPITTPVDPKLKPDIFSGAVGTVAVSDDVTDTPTATDPKFVLINNVNSFPSLGRQTEVQEIDTYDSEFVSKMVGNQSLNDVELSVYIDPNGDHTHSMLDDAILNKTDLRFRNTYEMSTGDQAKVHYYELYEAVPVASYDSGGDDSAVTRTYTLSVTNALESGVMRVGDPLLTGDFGVGAGTDEFPGVLDTNKLSGNRFLQFKASNADNPFGAGAAAIAIQDSEQAGSQLVINCSGSPFIRVRNITGDGSKTDWYKVYTSADKPTPNEIGAVSLAGDTMTGNLTAPNVTATNVVTANTLTGKTSVTVGVDGANATSSINMFAGSSSSSTNNWKMVTDKVDGLTIVGGTAQTAKFCSVGDVAVLRDVSVGRNLGVTGDVSVGGVKAVTVDGSNIAFGDTIKNVQLRSTLAAGWNGITMSYDGGTNTAIMLNERNYTNAVDKTHVKKTGDTMTGNLVINQNNTAIRLTSSNNRGYVQAGNVAGATDPNIQTLWLTGYNGVDLTEFNIKTAASSYANIRINGNAIYHAGYRPSAADIGAIDLNDVIDLGYL